MTNQVAPNKKQQAQHPSKSSPSKAPNKAHEQSKKPNQRDASDLPSGWAFAT